MQLLVVAGPDKDRAFPLQVGPDLMLGRSPQAYYQVKDPSVSRNHCLILREGDQVTVIDNGGGTLINGQKIERQVLQPGDILQVGHTQLRLQSDDEPPPEEEDSVEVVDVEVVEETNTAAPEIDLLRVLTGRKLSHFDIGPIIGPGTFGMVFRATDLNTQRPVAMKVLCPETLPNDEAVQHFSAAMKTALALRHNHLVSLLGAGKSARYCWMALELIEGHSTTQRIHKVHEVSKADWPGAFRVAVHVARALAFAHDQHLVHRNITPADVLVEAATRTVKLGDLVLSRALESVLPQHITPPAKPLGDVAYMAPERTRGLAEVDERTDLYGLGAIVFALLTGHSPHEGTTPAEAFQRIHLAERDKLAKHHFPVPRSFEKVVLRLLANRKDARFQTAGELLDELDKIREAESLTV
jgi:serine/threonine protein kinase